MNNIKVSNAQKITIERNGKSPYIDESGTWFQFDDSLDDFVDTGVYAKGEKGDTGATGPQGVQGKPFTISKVYSSIEEMNNDLGNMEDGSYVMIANSVEQEDNAKLFVKSNDEWIFISDFSGATGIQGEQGPAGPQGEPGRTIEYQPGEGVEVAENNVLNLVKATSNTLGGIKVGENLSIDEDGVLSAEGGELPIATSEVLGGIKVGDNLTIDENGKLSSINDAVLPVYDNTSDEYMYLSDIPDGVMLIHGKWKHNPLTSFDMSYYDTDLTLIMKYNNTGFMLKKDTDGRLVTNKITQVSSNYKSAGTSNTYWLYTPVNNLTTTSTGKPLDAKQGKVLNDKIIEINNTIGDINSVLATLVTVEEDV